MTKTMAGIPTAKVVVTDYTLFSFRELVRRSQTEPGAAAELTKRQQANAARKARWADPSYQAEQAAKQREIIASWQRGEEKLYQGIVALNADYKSAIDAMDSDEAYRWYLLTTPASNSIDALTGRIRLNGHDHIALVNAAEIHKYIFEVHPDFRDRFLDSHSVPQPELPDRSPVGKTRRVPARRYRTW